MEKLKQLGSKLMSDQIIFSEELKTNHYDVFNYSITSKDIENGFIRLDPYKMGEIWEVGSRDNTGCLFHMLKTIARFGLKDGNTTLREIQSIKATIARMEEIYTEKLAVESHNTELGNKKSLTKI